MYSKRVIEYLNIPMYTIQSWWVQDSRSFKNQGLLLMVVLTLRSFRLYRGVEKRPHVLKKTTDVQMKPVTNYSEIYSVAVIFKRTEKVDYSLLNGVKSLPSLVVRVSLSPLVLNSRATKLLLQNTPSFEY